MILAKELSTFETVCTQMLEDVQERLVYRTQVYIRNEILAYKPSPGDIAYPDKLEMMQVMTYKCIYSSIENLSSLSILENCSIIKRTTCIKIKFSIIS